MAVYIYTPEVPNIASSIAQHSIVGIKIYFNACESIWLISGAVTIYLQQAPTDAHLIELGVP